MQWMNASGDQGGWAPVKPAQPAGVRGILTVTIGAFLLQSLIDIRTGGALTSHLALSREGLLGGQIWQLVSYMLLHGGLWHIVLNMLVVYMFGRELEQRLGTRSFLALYVGSGVLAGLGWVLLSGRGYCIGASGGVFGLIGVYAALFPYRPITLFILFVLPVTMKARTMALLLGIVSLVSMFSDGNIAHSAHLTGGIIGYLYGYGLNRRGGSRHPSDGRWG